jgi:hypothetical protein
VTVEIHESDHDRDLRECYKRLDRSAKLIAKAWSELDEDHKSEVHSGFRDDTGVELPYFGYGASDTAVGWALALIAAHDADIGGLPTTIGEARELFAVPEDD